MPISPSPSRLHVAVCLTLQRDYARNVLGGLAAYAATKSDWSLKLFQMHNLREPGFKARYGVDAVVGLFCSEDEISLVRNVLKLPAVNVGGRVVSDLIPSVYPNNFATGAMVAEYFLAQGQTNFAYCGIKGLLFSDERLDGFRHTVAEAGFTVRHFLLPDADSADHFPQQLDRQLGTWLTALGKPAGLMVVSDAVGVQLADVCHHLGLAVPQELSLVGVGFEKPNQYLSRVELSNVVFATHEIGLQAGRLLDGVLARKVSPDTRILVRPLRIAEGQSSNILATKNPYLEKALNYIRANYHMPLDVAAIATHAGVARRTLEKLFRKHLQRAPKEEIDRIRLHRARELIARTDLKFDAIAAEIGLTDGRHLCVLFTTKFGMPPSEFRRLSQHDLLNA